MRLNTKNMARTTLTQNIGTTDTSFTVEDADILPVPPFRMTIENEIVEVGAKNVSTKTLSSVLRGQEGTTATAHANGTVVENRFTAGTYDEIKQTVIAHKAEKATTTTEGHVQLSDAINSTSTTLGATANAVKKAYDIGNHIHPYAPSTHTHTNSQVGLGNVDNVKQMPIAGGTFTGVTKAQNNTSYTIFQIRNIVLSTANPSGGSNGDIWIKYKA